MSEEQCFLVCIPLVLVNNELIVTKTAFGIAFRKCRSTRTLTGGARVACANQLEQSVNPGAAIGPQNEPSCP